MNLIYIEISSLKDESPSQGMSEVEHKWD